MTTKIKRRRSKKSKDNKEKKTIKSPKLRKRLSKKKDTQAPNVFIPPFLPSNYKVILTTLAALGVLGYLAKENWDKEAIKKIKDASDRALTFGNISGGWIPPEGGYPKQYNQKVGYLKGQIKWFTDFINSIIKAKNGELTSELGSNLK